MRVAFKLFTEVFGSWESRCQKAAEFASRVSPDHLINISCTEVGLVVWYWDDEAQPDDRDA